MELDPRIAGFLGRILDEAGYPCGTCFQVAPGVLVTAWHVLDGLGATADDAVVRLDPLQGSGPPRDARVRRTDPQHDLAVLITAEPLPGCVARLAASDKIPKRALVSITGVIELDDLGHSYRSWDADGQWGGGTTRDDQIRLGRVVANDVMKGMSGAPVLLAGQTVAGVVSARYNSGDEWGQGTVWVARTENLVPLLVGLTDILLHDVTEQPAPRQQDFSEVFNRLRDIHFTERPWLTGRIQAFLGNRPRGYFFIEGKTGVGKTTLAAEMARQGNYPHHFCSRDSSISSGIYTALGSLAAQLVAKFGVSEAEDSVIGSLGPSEFRSLLGEAAAVAAKRGEQLVLIVDGLDHAELCPGALPLGLPAELPDNVYVIATTREGILLDERRQYSEHIRIDPNESAVLADIRRHIDATLLVDERLRNRVTERMSAHEFREIVVTRCRGVWIYVRIVLADVRDGRISVDALPDLPTELWTYYSRTLRELGGTNNGDLCLPVLSTLACAAEPLLLTTLCTLADVSSQRQGSVRTLVTGQLRSFVVTVGDGIEGPYIPLHDSARDFLIGRRPDTDSPMSGDWQRLDELASAAVDTHNRIANRYLAAWGGLESGLAELMADPKLGWLDYGYGMRHVTGHLEYSDRQDELHRLMDQYSWYAAHQPYRPHQEQGRYVEYRSDLARARRLAAQRTDRALAAGEIAPAIGREIRYSLMDASVESVSASMTPGLLGAFVERRLLGPQAAAWHIRAVVDYPTRVEMVASLMCVRYRRENESLAELAAWHTWDLVFPPRTPRSLEVAGDVLYHLPRYTRESYVANLLKVAANPDCPKPGRLLRMLARSLSDKDLEDATNVALTIQGDDEDKNTAFIALVPHLPDSMLGRIAQSETNCAPGCLKLQRVLALRLATSCHAGTEWATKYIVHELGPSIRGLGNQEMLWRAGDTETLLNGFDDSRRAAELDKIVTDLAWEARNHQFPPFEQNGAVSFSETQVQRLLAAIPRKPIGYSRPYALSRLLPGLPAGQRPAVVTEALRALRRYKDINPLRSDTIRALASHITTHNMADIRALVNALAKDGDLLGSVHAEILAVLSSRSSNSQENAQLRQEAVTVAANCSNKLKADAIEGIAPYLDQETRRIAFGLVEHIEPGGIRNPRHRALDALVAHVQNEEELRYARSIAERIHDPLSQASSFAGMAGHVAKKTRDKLRGKIEQLVDSTDSRERAGVLIMLAHNFPNASAEHHQLLRHAASLIPADQEIGRWGTAEHLAAVRPVLTPKEVQDRVLAAVGNRSLKWECLDTWNALTPGLPDTHVRQIIKAAQKRRNRAGEHEICALIAMVTPHLRQSEIDETRMFAEGRHERYRAMPLAALVHRVSEPHRGRIIRQVLEDIRPRGLLKSEVLGELEAQPLAALAPAMTDDEREELIDIIVLQRSKEALTLLAALVEFFPRLPGAQQARVMAAATDSLPESFLFDSPDFPKVVRHADPAFLQRMLEAARYSSENLKVEAIIAVLGSPTTTNNGSWVAGGSDLVGPLRELFTGLTRPSLLRVLGAAAPHIAAHGGQEAVEECVTAVEDVTRWWP